MTERRPDDCCDAMAGLICAPSPDGPAFAIVHGRTGPPRVSLIESDGTNVREVARDLVACPRCGAALDVEALMADPRIEHWRSVARLVTHSP